MTMTKKKLAEMIIRIWSLGILIILTVAGVLVLTDYIKNPLSFNQVTGIVILIFALVHTDFISKKLKEDA